MPAHPSSLYHPHLHPFISFTDYCIFPLSSLIFLIYLFLMALLAYYFSLNVNIHEYKDLYLERKETRRLKFMNERTVKESS